MKELGEIGVEWIEMIPPGAVRVGANARKGRRGFLEAIARVADTPGESARIARYAKAASAWSAISRARKANPKLMEAVEVFILEGDGGTATVYARATTNGRA